ncbi:hypothetical protein RJ639_045862 [Escallonia herrerae]|uniref:Vacuolar protein sorting-associated protein 33A n=1 Tax=Escallonia herrerae TaxID=1293975 RepID=A0AA88WA54_9ASTE|nr:hypothetical protein RJ639_045862 [Escallonia herrerae]
MAQIPNLDNAPLNFTSLRDQSQKELINILKNIRGRKCLVIDPKLGGSISSIVQTSLLKAILNSSCYFFWFVSPEAKKQEHGVELRHLTADPIQTECTKVVYLVRSQIDLMKFICSHIHNDISKGLQREYFVYFVPRRAVVCEKILEEEKVHHLLNIGEYPLYAIPLDEDVLSFELDLAYKDCLVDGDTTSLWHIAKAIHELEFSFGLIPNVRAKGKASVRVADILNRMQAEEPVNASDVTVQHFCSLSKIFIQNRSQLLRINNGAVELDSSIMGVQQDGKKIKVPLNSSDKLFKETRDLNFEVVVQVRPLAAICIVTAGSTSKSNLHEAGLHGDVNYLQSQTVSELKDFVRKLNSLPEMTRHINLAQHLSTYTSKPAFLGRLDMEHTIVEAQSYDMRELLHSYGFEHMATLNNLEKAGLLKKQESKGNWLTVKRALQLVVDDTDTANPNDISYVFSGYAPLSIRLVQHAIRSGWRPIEDILKLLPGPHSETKRSGFASSPSFDSLPGAPHTADKVGGGRRSLVLVVFIGGVTFAEISALRFLSAQEGMAYDLVVGTTKIVSGHTLTEAFVENLG